MGKRKTRKEKERVRYHIESSLLKVSKRREEKDVSEFEYLDARYIKKDLIKTVVYSVLMFVLIFLAKRFM